MSPPHITACLSYRGFHATASGPVCLCLSKPPCQALASLYKALTNRSLQLSNQEMDPPWALFSQAFPYLRFAYAIIAQTLVRAMSAERVIPVVDLGSGYPNFGVPLIQSSALMVQARKPPQLKITFVNTNKVVLEKLGLRLVK